MLLVRLAVYKKEIGTWNYVVRRNGISRLAARASTVTTWRVRTHSFFMQRFLLFFVFIRFFLIFCSPLHPFLPIAISRYSLRSTYSPLFPFSHFFSLVSVSTHFTFFRFYRLVWSLSFSELAERSAA